MELSNQTSNESAAPSENDKKENKNYWQWLAVGFVGVFALTQLFDVNIGVKPRFGSGKTWQAGLNQSQNQDNLNLSDLKEAVLPSKGKILPIKWGDLGRQMVEVGVIDEEKFESLYAQRGGLDENKRKLLYGQDNGNLIINEENSEFLLNLLWAFGLANKNIILEEGPMQDEKYGGDASRFASTGGWSLSMGSVMDHYSAHFFIALTKEQQALVEEVSQNIYRPCCGNSTYFPDCNHGMAMLGLLELLAREGASEEEMYKTALLVNSYWFRDTYLTIAKYFEKRGVSWSEISPKEILSSAYSSASGYQQILQEVEPFQSSRGAACGV